MRLNKFLASSGFSSRRGADEVIKNGKVRVNGKRAVLGLDVDPSKDKVELFTDTWRVISAEDERVVYALNKPAGYVSTVSDPDGKKTVVSLVPPLPRVFPVGRLDEDSKGLILLTNDGDLTQRLTHPSTHVQKEYRVVCEFSKQLQKDEFEHHLDKVRKGVLLKEGRTMPAHIEVLDFYPGRCVLRITISEGKRRQIRRSMQKIQMTVVELERTRIGGLTLASLGLAPRKFVRLSFEQINLLTA